MEVTKGQAEDCMSDGSLHSDYETVVLECAVCTHGLLECRETHRESLEIRGNSLNRLLYCFSPSIEMHHLSKDSILTFRVFQGDKGKTR